MRHGPTIRRCSAVVVASLLLLAACSSTKKQHSSVSKTLRIPFSADMGTPDPAQFYAVEGLLVTTNVYEGLVRYKAGTATIEPALATSYQVSSDGRTYTFRLRAGVHFHDGSTMSSADVQKSFQRFSAVKGGPSYMLADVASMQTPDAATFVVTLKRPVSAFLDYLAAPYGPKVLSSQTLQAHAGNDQAKTYLSTHDAGTGPYTITGWKVGQLYTLSAFPRYWGGAPFFNTVEIPIIANFSTQRLELEQGQLDMLLSNVPKSDAQSLQQSGFQVRDFPVDNKAELIINPNTGVFSSLAAREGLVRAINRQSLVANVFGNAATVSTQVYPAYTFPAGLGMDNPPYDPSMLTSLVAGMSNKSVKIEYPAEGGAVTNRLAETIQTQLQATGLNVTVRSAPFAQLFTLATHPAARPDLLTLIAPPDAPHPDAWIRLLAYSTSPVNYLGCTVRGVDSAIDQGLRSTNAQQGVASYAHAADLWVQDQCSLGLADVRDTIVAAKGITGIVHDLSTPGAVRLVGLRG